MNIAILLPLKEKYTSIGCGAVSILVNTHLKKSKYKKTTRIYGSNIRNPLDPDSFRPLVANKNFFSNLSYVNSFEKQIFPKTDIIELHNRPKYFFQLKKKFPDKKFILFFHNDPLDQTGSITLNDRKFLYEKVDKLVFLSVWMKDQFFKDLKITDTNKINIFYPGITVLKKFPSKKNIILFVGKLNHSKGYDIYMDAVSNFLKTHKNWKAIAIGSESRREIPKNRKIFEVGEISNKEVLKLIAQSKITIAPSRWNEPLGRLPLESASRGSFPIVSNKGGLIETVVEDFSILKKNNSTELLKKLNFLANNPKKLILMQKNVFKKFKYSLKKSTSYVDNIRQDLFKENLPTPGQNLKILHVASFNETSNGSLYYSTANKFNIGFTKLNHFVQSIDDKFFLKSNFINTTTSLNKKIINTVKNFGPDIIFLGHTNKITSSTLEKIKVLLPNVKICRWYIDSISPEFFNNNSKILLNNIKHIDKIFITSLPSRHLSKFKNKFCFIPNPVDSSVEKNKNFLKNNLLYDLFFSLSHGQHRGVLKSGKKDERDDFIDYLYNSLYQLKKYFISTTFNSPKWGSEFFYYLGNARMGLNMSRGQYQKLYSSDRIASLIGNGLLTFMDQKTNYGKFFTNKEIVFYKNKDDLIKKILFFKKNEILAKKYAKNAYIKYHKYFNAKEVCSYILSECDLIKRKKFYWLK